MLNILFDDLCFLERWLGLLNVKGNIRNVWMVGNLYSFDFFLDKENGGWK